MKIKFSILLLLISAVSYGQDTPYLKPVTPTPMSANYWFKQQVWIDSVLKARKAIFKDTVGLQGKTFVENASSGDSNKIAVNTAYMKKWIADNVTPGIPGQPAAGWSTTGNYSPSDPTPYRLGNKDSFGLHFITNNTVRMILPDNGINRSSGAANKYLSYDTITHKIYYTDGGSGGGGSGTVTSVGSGYGLSGGPITSSGTLSADTTSSTGLVSKTRADNIYFKLADSTGKWVGHVERKTDSLIVYEGSGRTAYYVPSSTGVDTSFVELTTSGIPPNTFPTNKGLHIKNTVAATSTTSYKVLLFRASSYGWATNSGGTSQVYDWYGDVSSSNSTVNPLSKFSISSSVNGGTISQRFSIDGNGNAVIGDGVSAGTGTLGVYGNITLFGASTGTFTIRSTSSNRSSFVLNNAGANYWDFGSASGNFSLNNTNRGTTPMYIPDVAGTPRIGINNNSPSSTSVLDIASTDRGVLIPRMTKTQRNAISSPAAGLMVIVTGETGGEYLSVYNANQTRWEKVNTTAD